MLPKLEPTENQYGAPVAQFIPAEVTGIFAMEPEHRAVWELAEPYLKVRDNDAHTVYAYGLARTICASEPDADPGIVLPAILLHDTGWSQVPEELVLRAISPAGGDPELVLLHEREGVRLATGILESLGFAPNRIAEIVDIISTHDSMKAAKSLNDAIVKDADKLWRLSPHGIDTVMDWFGLDRAAAARLCSWRVQDFVHTDAARTLARGLAAIASIDAAPERVALG
ncbi:HD domain-containing protein [Leucobacter sp. gxy201]|uniref:HD domain-containing protein n=1 Tax=Leucobacter sp. gxy201 TaxID=2957200 RepID=UPI003DA14C0A